MLCEIGSDCMAEEREQQVVEQEAVQKSNENISYSSEDNSGCDLVYSNEEDKKGKSKAKKSIIIALSAVLAVLIAGVCLVGVYVKDYDRIMPNIYVADIELGGRTAEDALVLLDAEYFAEKIKDMSIPLSCVDTNSQININDLQVQYNNQAVVDEAMAIGKSENIFAKALSFITHSVHKTQLEPVITYNSDNLNAVIDETAKAYEIEPVGHTFTIEPNQVTIIGRVNGIKVNRPLIIEEVEKQIREKKFEGILMVPRNVEPAPFDFDEFYTWLTSDAQDAYYVKNEEGKVVVNPGKLKCTVERDVVKSAIRDIKNSPDNKAVIAVTTTEPEVTTAKLEETLYKDVLGDYFTYYTGSAARISNVRLAISRINGTELMPGEEFSYDKTILPRNRANGYAPAPVFVGNDSAIDYGGGICQPSSTLYAAALDANLEILERHNHSMAVGYIYNGLDATIAEGVLDMRFRNNSGYPVKIVADSSGGKATFTIMGYDPENISVDIIRSAGGGGYHVTRVVKKDGVEIKREKMTSSYYQQKKKKTEGQN